MDVNSLDHTKWNCKNHIELALKYRGKSTLMIYDGM